MGDWGGGGGGGSRQTQITIALPFSRPVLVIQIFQNTFSGFFSNKQLLLLPGSTTLTNFTKHSTLKHTKTEDCSLCENEN